MHPGHFFLSIAFLFTGCINLAFAQIRMLPEGAFLVSGAALQSQINSDGSIPRSLWGTPIQKLKPLRVYRHRVNVAVVTSENEREERGIYFKVPTSSYLPKDRPGMKYRWDSDSENLKYVFTK